MPISSYTSVPSYAPIVTSKLPSSFFSQGSPTKPILERVFFGEIFSEALDQNTLHCLSEKRYYSIVRTVSVRYVQAEDCKTRLHVTLST